MEGKPLWTGVTAFAKVKVTESGSSAGSSSVGTRLGHAPWPGATPLSPTKLEDPSVFVRRYDGVWCRRDTSNRLYPVNRYGERIAKPNTFLEGGSGSVDQQRHASLIPHLW